MTTDIQLFNNPEFGSVRIVICDDEPWFVAKDVCECLSIANSRDSVAKLRDKDKGVVSTDTLGGKQALAIVSEPGMYELVLGSRKPEAKQFKYWICDSVLPSIRKSGSYSVAPKTYQEALRALADEIDHREMQEKLLAEKISELSDAVHTKAYISDKKTATAMATASAATRKVAALENQLGAGAKWKTVLAIDWLSKEFNVNAAFGRVVGAKLSKLSATLGYKIEKAPDERYGSVNRYRIEVINALHDIVINNKEMWAKYRKETKNG